MSLFCELWDEFIDANFWKHFPLGQLTAWCTLIATQSWQCMHDWYNIHMFEKLWSNGTKLDKQPYPFQFNSCLVCKQNILSDLHVQDEGIYFILYSTDEFCWFVFTLTGREEVFMFLFPSSMDFKVYFWSLNSIIIIKDHFSMDVGQKIYFFFKEKEMHNIQIPVQTARISQSDTRTATVGCYTYNYP